MRQSSAENISILVTAFLFASVVPTMPAGAAGTTEEAVPAFYLPEDPNYTILDSAADSVRFTVERTLVEYKGNLSSKSSFVDKDGNIMD